MLNRLVEKGRSKSKRLLPGQQSLPFAFDLRLHQIPDNWHQIAVRFRKANGIRDGEKNDVFGSYVGEIDISVGMENRGVWLCCEWK